MPAATDCGAAQDAAAEAAKIKAILEEYVQLLQEIFQYYAGAAEVKARLC